MEKELDYCSTQKDVICTVCKDNAKGPAQSRRAWAARAVNNWAKASVLLVKHAKSDWHLATIER